jgi:hypothetical protein
MKIQKHSGTGKLLTYLARKLTFHLLSLRKFESLDPEDEGRMLLRIVDNCLHFETVSNSQKTCYFLAENFIYFFQKIVFCKMWNITNCKILLTYVHLAVILCTLKAENSQGRPKRVAYIVRFNKFVVLDGNI